MMPAAKSKGAEFADSRGLAVLRKSQIKGRMSFRRLEASPYFVIGVYFIGDLFFAALLALLAFLKQDEKSLKFIEAMEDFL